MKVCKTIDFGASRSVLNRESKCISRIQSHFVRANYCLPLLEGIRCNHSTARWLAGAPEKAATLEPALISAVQRVES